MKAAGEPMSLQDIAILLKRASEVSNHRRFVVAGSLVVTGAVVKAPADPNDAAIGKLMRGEENDIRWVRAGFALDWRNAS